MKWEKMCYIIYTALQFKTISDMLAFANEETIHVTEENIYSNYSVIQEKGEFEIIMHQTKDKIETYYDYDREDDSEETIKVQP